MTDYTYEYAYNIKYSAATGFTLGKTYRVGVELSSDTPVLTNGSTLTTVATANLKTPQTLIYEGTVVDDGSYVGAVVYDETSKKLLLLTNATTLVSSSALTIDYASSPVPGGKANYDLANGGSATAACFLAGTMIATPDGEVAVETLRNGDLVRVTDGRVLPVCWVGRQTVSRRFADPMRVLPVRIRAGALGASQPQRDLLLSPDHALLLDDVLVQAGALVNDISILREVDVPPTFTYYHVEVADHALLYAEGVPAESFIDNVDRLAFDNWAEHVTADLGVVIVEMDLPRAKAVRQVPAAIRSRLATRAAALFGAEMASAA